jgi:purine-nucleoside phosphorylase
MSLHLEAAIGEIAPTVLITGDPLRARHFATYLEQSSCYNEVRGMFGYTGLYRGREISIQGTGMGIPSTAIYLHELIRDYGVKRVIRVGTCGAIQQELSLGQIIIATTADTDSSAVQHYTVKQQLPTPNPILLRAATDLAPTLNISVQTGSIFSTDLFYTEDSHRYEELTRKNVLAVDMETSMVYAMANYFAVESLSILTVSDNILTGKALTAKDREQQTTEMLRFALEIAVAS